MKKSVSSKIFLIILVGSFIGAIFVAVLVFFLTSEDPKKSFIAFIGSQTLFLIPVFGIKKIIDGIIVEKLRVVSRAMQEVSMGNLDYEIKVEETGDELEELAESFERMRISLKTIMEKLEEGEL